MQLKNRRKERNGGTRTMMAITTTTDQLVSFWRIHTHLFFFAMCACKSLLDFCTWSLRSNEEIMQCDLLVGSIFKSQRSSWSSQVIAIFFCVLGILMLSSLASVSFCSYYAIHFTKGKEVKGKLSRFSLDFFSPQVWFLAISTKPPLNSALFCFHRTEV